MAYPDFAKKFLINSDVLYHRPPICDDDIEFWITGRDVIKWPGDDIAKLRSATADDAAT
ncbi:hypothetical protein DAPPUDRAFT_263834 [Daphnia pulex]|uniref:Uncharacterized protein n=1 Tax=Daphnia pulex TaxID=6669 RepID=E9HQH2_DAPPU|nr:hypothetical protein DAPPUDRAFT_263834 [Daphnia pulex]|eukprot:EFX66013.1 hypothetical protein DAPPUDRAFT_263834 [Daphnia pulex]